LYTIIDYRSKLVVWFEGQISIYIIIQSMKRSGPDKDDPR
jgi:hypothetical protein